MTSASVFEFLPTIEDQAGDRYVFAAEASFRDPDPDAFDCSELIEWGLARVGVPFVDGSRNQLEFCRRHRTTITVPQGLGTWGALLFRMTGSPTHVAVSLGDGTTFEARGKAYGVNRFAGARTRPWTHAARIPGLSYDRAPTAPPKIEPGGRRMDTPDDAQVQAALGRAETWVRKMHELDRTRFPLVALDHTAGDHLPPAQAAIHDAAERLDDELPAMFEAYRRALGK